MIFVLSIENCAESFNGKCLQVFLDDIVDFAKKFDCVDLVFNEHRRRAKSDERSTVLYRCTTLQPKNMFAVSYDTDSISIEKYNPITDRWAHIRKYNIPIDASRSHLSSDLTLANNILCLVDANAKKVRSYFWSHNLEIGTIHFIDLLRMTLSSTGSCSFVRQVGI